MVCLFEDINKAKKKRGSPIRRTVQKRKGGHLLGGQSSAAKKFSTTFWSRPPLKRWKVFIIFILWVRLRMTKFNCGETKGRLLWRCEPGEVYKFKFKYQILSIKYQIQGRLLGVSEFGKVYMFKFKYPVSCIKYQILNINYHYLGDASPERYWRISSFLSFAKPCGLGGGGDGKMKRGWCVY